MGTFYGHVLPGVIMFAFGTWWSLRTWRQHARCRASGERFLASASAGRAEGVVKIAAATLGLATEGTWLIQIAFLLFDPREGKRWDPRSDRDAMLAAAIFPVHVVAALVYVCLLGTVFSRRAEVAYSRLAQEADKEKEHCLSAASVRPGILAALIP